MRKRLVAPLVRARLDSTFEASVKRARRGAGPPLARPWRATEPISPGVPRVGGPVWRQRAARAEACFALEGVYIIITTRYQVHTCKRGGESEWRSLIKRQIPPPTKERKERCNRIQKESDRREEGGFHPHTPPFDCQRLGANDCKWLRCANPLRQFRLVPTSVRCALGIATRRLHRCAIS